MKKLKKNQIPALTVAEQDKLRRVFMGIGLGFLLDLKNTIALKPYGCI